MSQIVRKARYSFYLLGSPRIISCLPVILLGVFLSVLATISLASSDPNERGAIINHLIWKCDVDENKFSIWHSKSVTVLNERGSEFGNSFAREGKFSRVKSISVRVTDSQGKEIYKKSKKDFDRFCGYGSSGTLYTDDCYYYLKAQAQSYPYTVETEYEIAFKSLFFWKGKEFQTRAPVTTASYTLTIPRSLEFDFKLYGLDIEPTVEDIGRSKHRYTWLATDLPGLKDVTHLPPGENDPARLVFAPQAMKFGRYQVTSCDWDAIGHWYEQMSLKKYLPKKQQFWPTDKEKIPLLIDSLFQQVTDKVRYVAVQIGIGGWQPYDAALTASRGYGDCKDMATLLVSNLRNRGIRAYQALINTRRVGLTDVEFPQYTFNHVITVAVTETDTIWMDATCNNCPAGTLPAGDQNLWALVASNRGGQLWKTQASTCEDNVSERTTEWHVDADLNCTFHSKLKVTGAPARYFRSILDGMTADETRIFISKWFRGADKKFEITSYKVVSADQQGGQVEITVDAKLYRPARLIGDKVYCNPFSLAALGKLEMTRLKNRTFPLHRYYPSKQIDIISVSWDDALNVDSVLLPGEESLDYSNGSFTFRSFDEGTRFEIERKNYAYVLEVADFADYETYRKKIKKALAQPVTLVVK